MPIFLHQGVIGVPVLESVVYCVGYCYHSREDFQQENDVIQALAELPEDVKKELGYKLDEFLLECEFNGVECSLR